MTTDGNNAVAIDPEALKILREMQDQMKQVQLSVVSHDAEHSAPNAVKCFDTNAPAANQDTYTNYQGVTLVYDNPLNDTFNKPTIEGQQQVQEMLKNGESCKVTDADKVPKQDDAAAEVVKELKVDPVTPTGQ
jgi:hypothetical protein